MDGRWSVTGGDLTPEWDVDGAAGTEDFRSVMRRAVGGLAVVTTLHEGRAWGMTVSAFSVVSVAPPTLLVCVGNGTVTADDAIRDGRFAVNLLSDAQVELSRLCARPGAAKYLDDHVLPAGALPRPVAPRASRLPVVICPCGCARLLPARLDGHKALFLTAVSCGERDFDV